MKKTADDMKFARNRWPGAFDPARPENASLPAPGRVKGETRENGGRNADASGRRGMYVPLQSDPDILRRRK